MTALPMKLGKMLLLLLRDALGLLILICWRGFRRGQYTGREGRRLRREGRG